MPTPTAPDERESAVSSPTRPALRMVSATPRAKTNNATIAPTSSPLDTSTSVRADENFAATSAGDIVGSGPWLSVTIAGMISARNNKPAAPVQPETRRRCTELTALAIGYPPIERLCSAEFDTLYHRVRAG